MTDPDPIHAPSPTVRPRNALLGALATAAVAGTAMMLLRGAARDESRITYEPVDQLKPFAERLWIVDSGPVRAMGLALPVRMAVLSLGDGGLLLHSPTRYTPELGRAIDALGTVRHIVAPTMAHWMFVEAWQRAYPDATCWGVAALADREPVRKSDVRIDQVLTDTAPDAWSNDIEQGIVAGGGFEEAWFFHKPSRTLLLTDLVENLDPAKLTRATAAVMRATFATSATTGLHVRLALRLGGRKAKDAVRAMLATNPDRVLFAHGDPFSMDGATRLRRAFAWLV
ncbi:MAG: DUF4336 domain-containing protein [Sphingomonas paucimobilis]